MKKLLFILLLSPLFSVAQYRESGDTIFVNNKILLPGDTLHLGMGSDPYKNFVFVTFKPNMFNASVINGVASVSSVRSQQAFKFLIYKGMTYTGKKAIKHQTGYPYFYLNGYRGPYNTCYIQMLPAVASKEILL